MQAKTVKITNNQYTFEVECTKTMNLQISENIIQGFNRYDKVDIKKIILDAILNELNIPKEEWSTWSLV